MLNIIDISSWQAGLSLDAMFSRNPTLDGVIVKTSGGASYVNEYADAWIQWLRAHGKPWGFYHYVTEYSIRKTPQEEADWWLQHAGAYFGEGSAWLDYENQVALALGPGFLYEVARRIYEATGIKPGVYFSWGLLQWQDFSALASEGYPFWCARYAGYQFTGLQAHPWDSFSPAPFPKMTMLQYASSGRLPGWGANLDLNLFYGSYSEWQALARGEKHTVAPLKPADPQVVSDVLLNEYGTKDTVPSRQELLRQAGYDPYDVQRKLDELYGVADKVRPLVASNMDYINSIMKIVRM